MFYIYDWTPQGLRQIVGDESLVYLTAVWPMSGKRGFIKWTG